MKIKIYLVMLGLILPFGKILKAEKVSVVHDFKNKNAEVCLLNNDYCNIKQGSITNGWLYSDKWIGSADFVICSEIKIDSADNRIAFEMGRAREGIVFGDDDGNVVLKF